MSGFDEDKFENNDLNEKENIILHTLYNSVELSISEIQELIDQKTIYPLI